MCGFEDIEIHMRPRLNHLACARWFRDTCAMRCLSRIIAGACALFLICFSALAGERLTVFAAASLKGALDEAVAQFPSGVVVSYGGSGLIARQVAQGAPADLVILANQDWMEWLTSTGRPKLLFRNTILGNTLVLIAPADAAPLTEVTETSILNRLSGGRIATGMTDSVPAGLYGRQWLENAGLWTALSPHLAETDNVRAALALVARGEAPLGIVYASDADAEPRVQVLYAIPPDLHDPITYPFAVIDGKNAAQATELAEFLQTSGAQAIFRKHGFAPKAGGS